MSHDKGIPFRKPRKQDVDDVLYGSSAYIQTEKLDRKAVDTAIIRCLMPFEWKLEEYSHVDAAKDVLKELKKAGFPNVTSYRSIISQKNVKFKVVRPEQNMDIFVAVEEKKKERGTVECHYLIK